MGVKRLFTTLCILLLIGFGFTKLKKGFLKVMDIDVTSKENAKRILPDGLSRWGFGQYLRDSKSFGNEIALSGISKECEPYVKAVELLNFIYYTPSSRTHTYQNLVRLPSTCSITDEWVAAAEKEYLKRCFFTNPELNDSLTPECVSTVYALRSEMTQMLLKSKRMEDIDNLGQLTDLLYAEVMKTRLSQEEFKLNRYRAKQIVTQMLDVDPNFKAAKRVSFFLSAQDALEASAGKSLRELNDIWSSLQKQYDDLKQFDAMEGFVPEYEAIIQTRGYDPGLTVQYASKLLAQNPNSGWAMLLSAYGHWKQDDHETAFKEVRASTMLAPGNKDYEAVQTALSQPGANEESFAPGLKLTLYPQDFDK